jgi:hypothetical protein
MTENRGVVWGDINAKNGYSYGYDCSRRIRVHKNEIFFTSSITLEAIDFLIDSIQKTVIANEQDNKGVVKETPPPSKIYVYMDSPPGESM